MKHFLLIAALLPIAVAAQVGTGVAFPPSAVPATAQALSTHLSGKTFHAVLADGTRVQSKFGADGGLASSAPGYYDTGKWRAEEGKLCGSLRKVGEFCNEARFDAGVLYLRRMNGEVIRYESE
jgi:hypothetical protein